MTPLVHIYGESHVAAVYGLEEAIFLHSLMFWYRTNRGNEMNFHDGRWWTYNSVKAFEEIFPWWNAGQIRRIIARCKEKGALLAGDYNKDRRDRTAWYTPSDKLLELYGELENKNCICRKQQMQSPEASASFDENGECIQRIPWGNHGETDMNPCSPPGQPQAAGTVVRQSQITSPEADAPPQAAGTVVRQSRMTSPEADASPADKPEPKPRRSRSRKSVPTHAPERFEQFWTFYPGGGSRLKAVAAWDALAPDDGLIDEMARALKRQTASRQWRDGVGIPHASTWLNNQRWTDKLPEEPRPREDDPGGWARDPEVSYDG